MEKEALKRIFKFLEEKGENRAPLKWKLVNNEPLTKYLDDELKEMIQPGFIKGEIIR